MWYFMDWDQHMDYTRQKWSVLIFLDKQSHNKGCDFVHRGHCFTRQGCYCACYCSCSFMFVVVYCDGFLNLL